MTIKKDLKVTIIQFNESKKIDNTNDVYDFLFRELLEMKKSQAKKKKLDKLKISVPTIYIKCGTNII